MVTSFWISFLKVGLDITIIRAFSKTLWPAGVIKACCNWLEETVSAIIFCILGVSSSSRTAFCIWMEGLDPAELEPPPPLDPPEDDPPEEPPPDDELPPPDEDPPPDPPDDPLCVEVVVPCSGCGEPRLMLHPDNNNTAHIVAVTPTTRLFMITPPNHLVLEDSQKGGRITNPNPSWLQ